MREINKLYILSKNKKYPNCIVDSFEYKKDNLYNHQELIKVRPVSIHIRKLTSNDVIKKKFLKKYRLLRPCISQISRQLLNYELKKKKDLDQKKVLKNNKVDISAEYVPKKSFPGFEAYLADSYCKINKNSLDMKIESCDILSNSMEPPLKKMRLNEQDDNFFIGFDTGCSPTRSLIKLKTVHLKKYKGLEPLKAPTGKHQPLPTIPCKLANSDTSLVLSHKDDNGKETVAVCKKNNLKLFNSDSTSKEIASEISVECENSTVKEKPCHTKFTDIRNSEIIDDKIVSECVPIKYIHSPRNEGVCEKFPSAKTIINCVARKHTFNHNFEICTLPKHGVSVENSSVNNYDKIPLGNTLSSNLRMKFSSAKMSDTNSVSLPPIFLRKNQNVDSDTEIISSCDSSVKALSSDEENSVDPFIYLKKTHDCTVDQVHISSDKHKKSESSDLVNDQFTDSDSTSDSLCSVSSSDLCESSGEELEIEEQPFVDMSKFLSCDFYSTKADEISRNEDIITYKSQNSQLKCDCQVKVCLLKALDITDTFCYRNKITGINGFKLKQLLCTLVHLPQNGYNNFTIETEEKLEEEKEETIETPYFLTVPDSLTHSLFSIIIKRDMRENHIPHLRLLDVVIRALCMLNPTMIKRPFISENRSQKNIQPMPVGIHNTSSIYSPIPISISRPAFLKSNGTYIPISNPSPVSSMNPNYNRMTLIPTNSTHPNFAPKLIPGNTGNLILLPSSMGTAHGGTLIIQQPNNSIRMSASTAGFIIGQSSHPAPPPLTLGSDLGRPGNAGQFSISQPPQLKRMNVQSAPIIDLTVNQNLQPCNLQNWPAGHFQKVFIGSAPNDDVSISCSSHPLELYQLHTLIKKVVDNLKVLLAVGFPKNEISIMNAAFQMLYSNNLICCKFHSISAVNKTGILRSVLLSSAGPIINNFVELPLPSPPQVQDTHPWIMPNHDMFIIKRFVFAVDKTTRAVIYPLPPNCIPKDNDSIDKITVVIMISPLRGLGPGLIVFPHSLLSRSLLLSLESATSVGNIGKDWVLSAHQRGGLTQSMLLEYMDECTIWVKQSSQVYQPMLAVDWWWCLEQKSLNSTFRTFTLVNLQEIYTLHKDPLEISLGTTMETIWGHLVRKFSVSIGPLTEAYFPKFIIQVLKDLCAPPRLIAWCRASGLFPLNKTKAEEYIKNVEILLGSQI